MRRLVETEGGAHTHVHVVHDKETFVARLPLPVPLVFTLISRYPCSDCFRLWGYPPQGLSVVD